MLERYRRQHAPGRAQRGGPGLPAAVRVPAEGARDARRRRGGELDLVRRRLRRGGRRQLPELRGRAREIGTVYADCNIAPEALADFARHRDAAIVGQRHTRALRLEDRRPRHAEGHGLPARPDVPHRRRDPEPSVPHFWFQREYLEQALEANGGQFDFARHDLGARRRSERASIRCMRQIDEMFRNSEARDRVGDREELFRNFFGLLEGLVVRDPDRDGAGRAVHRLHRREHGQHGGARAAAARSRS